MKNKKTLAVVLAALCIISSAFTGCSKSASSSKKESYSKDNINKTGYPIAKNKETIRIMIASDGKNPNDMKEFQDMEKNTNIHVDWEVYPYSQSTEKKNLAFASGDLPDAMGGWLLGQGDILTFGPQGVIIPLNELIDEYAPNFKNVLNEWPEAKKAITAPDGNIYSFPIINGAATFPDMENHISDMMLIDKKLLDKLNLKVPATTDEYYEVLKKIKENDPNKIGLSFFHKNGNDGWYSLFGSFGILDNPSHIINVNNKIEYSAIQPEYKEALKYFRKLYTEGLMDKEVFTQSKEQYTAKGSNNQLVSFINWDGVSIVGLDKIKNGEYIYLPPLKGPEGKQMWNKYTSGIYPTQFAITKAAKHPELIVRWIDELYAPEKSLNHAYGQKGVGWEKTSDGKYKMLDVSEEDSKDKLGTLGYAISKDVLNNLIRSEQDARRMEAVKAYGPYAKKQYPLDDLWISPDEQKKITSISTDVSKYVDEQIAKWVIGQGDIDKEWDGYINQLKKMKIDEMIEVYQQVYDKSMK